jgi:hypothetical protein
MTNMPKSEEIFTLFNDKTGTPSKSIDGMT